MRFTMKSIWNQSVQIPKRACMKGDHQADVVVIGAGLAGVLIAHRLQNMGKHVIVVDADRIGSGQTNNTTAKITSQHNLIYQKLISTIGLDAARQYAAANQKAIQNYGQFISRHSIQCHYEEQNAFLFSSHNTKVLQKEAAAAKKLGISASFVSIGRLPFQTAAAVCFQNQAQFHPLEFLEAVSAPLTIYERTEVLSVKKHLVHTNRGTIQAKSIVFACHYPFLNLPGFYFSRMYQERSYVLALEHAWQPDGMYLSVDTAGISLRKSGNLLLLGGYGHRTGITPKKNPYQQLLNTAHHHFSGSKEAARWSAQDCMTLDQIPYIGHFSSITPNWYVATGFNKWGMTSSMVAAMVIPDLIMGKNPSYAQVFSPKRFHITASTKELLKHSLESAKGLTMGLAKGAVRCPHMGCRLHWNPQDSSWDCPCHGSRFDPNGKLLDGPAQDCLSFID